MPVVVARRLAQPIYRSPWRARRAGQLTVWLQRGSGRRMDADLVGGMAPPRGLRLRVGLPRAQ
eukprot:4261978-Alexandrium_andersonii.AAC.1